MVEELAATAVDGVVGGDLSVWPLSMPDFDSRAATVLWCRGFRPTDADLAITADKLGGIALRRLWDDEVARLSTAQREEYLAAQSAVERGESDGRTLTEMWEVFFPDRFITYLVHLGQAVSDFLRHQSERL